MHILFEHYTFEKEKMKKQKTKKQKKLKQKPKQKKTNHKMVNEATLFFIFRHVTSFENRKMKKGKINNLVRKSQTHLTR